MIFPTGRQETSKALYNKSHDQVIQRMLFTLAALAQQVNWRHRCSRRRTAPCLSGDGTARLPVDTTDQFATQLFVCQCLDSRRGRTHKQGYRVRITKWTHATDMLKTLWATVRQGKIELLESAELPEGVMLLVTVLPDDKAQFWMDASQTSLDPVWDNTDDDVYARLLLTLESKSSLH